MSEFMNCTFLLTVVMETKVHGIQKRKAVKPAAHDACFPAKKTVLGIFHCEHAQLAH